MIRLFKKLKIAYIISLSILIAIDLAGIVFVAFHPDAPTTLLPIVAVSLYFLVVITFQVIAYKRHDKLIFILSKECDPIKFLNVYYPLLENTSKMDYKTKSIVQLNLASAYINAGDLAQARFVLGDININYLTKYHRVVYHSLWTTLFSAENNIKDAEYSLSFSKNLLARKKMNKILKKPYEAFIKMDEAVLNIMCDRLDGVEDTLLELYYTAEYQLMKVGAKYQLAKLYTKQNNAEKAVEAMKYVAENGNTLYIAQKARDYLQSSDNNTQA